MKKRSLAILIAFALVLPMLPGSVHASTMSTTVTANTVSAFYETSGVIDEKGDLWMWGDNSVGQVGNNYEYDIISPFFDYVKYQSVPVKVLSNVKTVSVGRNHTFAIRDDGDLYGWGSNMFGQLGTGNKTDQPVPVKIMSGVKAVSAGENHSAILKKDGTLWMCGANTSGQLGNNTTIDASAPVKVMDDVAAVAAGYMFTAAIKTDGTLWTWGDNDFGQLGNGTATNSHMPVKIMENVVAISAGSDLCTAAIKTDGTLWMWGNNRYGELGNGTTTNSRVPIEIMKDVASVSVGGCFTAAIKKDDSLWIWGGGTWGQLGNGAGINSSAPVKVMDHAATVSAGGNHTIAIKADGTVWSWGYNLYGGILGNGTRDEKVLSPVQIPGLKGAIPFADRPDLGGSKAYTELFPANGTTGFGTDAPNHVGVAATQFAISFEKPLLVKNNQPVLDFSKGTIALHSEDGKVLWEAKTYSSDNTCTDIVIMGSTNQRAFSIRPINLQTGALLDYGSKYYITVDPGVIQFADGSVMNGIDKGEWVFSTFAGTETISNKLSVRFDTKVNKKVTTLLVNWNESWFNEPSTTYNHELAITSLALSGSVYIRDGVKNALLEAGFEEKNINSNVNIDHDFALGAASDYVDYTIGYKELGGNYGDLVVISIRGTVETGEWANDVWFEPSTADHTAFVNTKNNLLNDVSDFLAKHDLRKGAKDLKFLVTGHSRGAAVANLLAVDLDGKYAYKDNIFVYTFASPTVSKNAQTVGYENIFNIINPEDLVPKLPPESMGYGRYGYTLRLPIASAYSTKALRSTFTKLLQNTKTQFTQLTGANYRTDNSLFTVDNTTLKDLIMSPGAYPRQDDAHSCAAYYSWMMSGTPDEIYVGTDDFKRIKIACPVDVNVYDADGTLVASVVNETIVVDELAVYLDGDAKIVDIPCDGIYSVEIIARDSGTMTYTVEEYTTSLNGNYYSDRSVVFGDIVLTPGDVFTEDINGAAGVGEERYFLTKNGDTIIDPDDDDFIGNVSDRNDGESQENIVPDKGSGNNVMVYIIVGVVVLIGIALAGVVLLICIVLFIRSRKKKNKI